MTDISISSMRLSERLLLTEKEALEDPNIVLIAEPRTHANVLNRRF